MNKAFTKEDSENEEDEDTPPERPLPKGSAYITPSGFRALQAELTRLWKVDRPKITEEVSVAAAHGDRSENAEYKYGKKKLREIDRRIRFLTKRLEILTVVETSPDQLNKVFFGAWVSVEDPDGKESTYRIVGPDELDLDKKWISIQSPLARALIGREAGEEVTVIRPKGPVDLEITAIRYEEIE